MEHSQDGCGTVIKNGQEKINQCGLQQQLKKLHEGWQLWHGATVTHRDSADFLQKLPTCPLSLPIPSHNSLPLPGLACGSLLL